MRTCTVIVLLIASTVVWAADQSNSAPKLLNAQDLPIEVESDALQRQYHALLAISPERVEYSPRGPINSIEGATGLSLPVRARDLIKGDDAADTILPVVGDFLLARGNESLTVRKNSLIDLSTRALRLSQSIRGIPVIRSVIAIDYDEATLRVTGLDAHFVPDRGLPRTPKLSAQEAEQIVPEALKAVESLRSATIEVQEGTYLAYYAHENESIPPQLVWVVQTANELFFVNAITGEIAGRQRETHTLTRQVYNANNTSPSLPGGLPTALSPSQIDADQQANEAYDHVGDANS